MALSRLGLALVAALLLPRVALAKDAGELPYRWAGSGASYLTLTEALQFGGDEEVLDIAPGVYADCAVISRDRLTLRARVAGSVVFDGKVCQHKAALVLARGNFLVQGIVFRNMHVLPEGNGAGIRLENASLTVRDSRFEDSDTGILTTANPNGRLTIENSQFIRLGHCRPDNCSHSLYAGQIASLTIRNTRFEAGQGGHYIKSRAFRTVLNDNSIDDRAGHQTSYLVDLPWGSAGEISGNSFLQGAAGQSRCCIIAVGAEGAPVPVTRLNVRGNTASKARRAPVVFLANPRGLDVDVSGNALEGWFIQSSAWSVAGRCILCKILD